MFSDCELPTVQTTCLQVSSLDSSIPSIDDEINTSSITRSITNKIQKSSLQLPRLRHPPSGSPPIPLVQFLFVMIYRHIRPDIPRTQCINPRKLNPFNSQAL